MTKRPRCLERFCGAREPSHRDPGARGLFEPRNPLLRALKRALISHYPHPQTVQNDGGPTTTAGCTNTPPARGLAARPTKLRERRSSAARLERRADRRGGRVRRQAPAGGERRRPQNEEDTAAADRRCGEGLGRADRTRAGRDVLRRGAGVARHPRLRARASAAPPPRKDGPSAAPAAAGSSASASAGKGARRGRPAARRSDGHR